MASSRDQFFKGKVIQNLYRDDDDSSDEGLEEKPTGTLAAVNTVPVKRKITTKQESNDTDWPVPLTKLKKVHTVSVKPEDIQESISNIVTCAPKEGGQESTTSREKRIARNKKRKLKKKRQKEKEKESKMRSTDTSTSSGREFTY